MKMFKQKTHPPPLAARPTPPPPPPPICTDFFRETQINVNLTESFREVTRLTAPSERVHRDRIRLPPRGKYSKIPILRPPLRLSKSGLKDHFWTVPKVVSNQMYTGCRK